MSLAFAFTQQIALAAAISLPDVDITHPRTPGAISLTQDPEFTLMEFHSVILVSIHGPQSRQTLPYVGYRTERPWQQRDHNIAGLPVSGMARIETNPS